MTSNVADTRRAIIKAAYAAGHNTYGHVAHVVEQRLEGSKKEDDWEPVSSSGNMAFDVVCLPDRHYPEETIPTVIYCHSSGKQAADSIAALRRYMPGFTYRVKRYMLPQDAADQVEANNTWKAREAQRMTDGTYTPLPWANEEWFKATHDRLQHYAHVSTEDKGKIAYTRDDDSGRRNIKVRVSVGRYLQEYYADTLRNLPSKETETTNVHGEKITVDALQWYVKSFTNQYGGGVVVKFACGPQDMVHVYTHGPASCMAYEVNQFQSAPIHPVEVYAAGDLQVAYIEDENKDITARALVWPERKAVGRIYGDHMSLSYALRELGYSGEDAMSLNGARLLQIPHGDTDAYVMPYIDGSGSYGQHPTDKGFFQIGGRNHAGYTHGLDRDLEEGEACDRCGDHYDLDDMVFVMVNRREDEQRWCECCVDHAGYFCEESNNTYSDAVPSIMTADGRTIARHRAGDYFVCVVMDEYYHIDDMAGLYEATGLPVSLDGAEGLLQDDNGRYWQPENFPALEEAVA